MKAKSLILYRGPSLLDGEPIVVVATTGSKNSKTGAMLQTWILRADMLATDAIHSGADASICGACPLRGTVVNGRNTGRKCYVKVFQAPRSVSAKVLRGGYEEAQNLADVADMGEGHMVRLGSYGDPAAVPAEVWRALISKSIGHTGYTHQWNNADGRQGSALALKSLVMASADTKELALKAQDMGYRTFRVTAKGAGPIVGEITCPASKEAGQKSTCAKCGLCKGATPEGRARSIPSIAINMH